MAEKIVFSVVVPFLNEEEHIEQCIRSLVEQDFPGERRQLIFIDNGSTDRSWEIVESFPEITLLAQEKKSSYAARNKGITHATGKILAFTDADCAVDRSWLSKIYKEMESGPEILLGRRCFIHGCSDLLCMIEEYEHAQTHYVLQKGYKKYFFAFTKNLAVQAEI